MRPIRDIADINTDHVLYHSAFGFARVAGVGPGFVRLSWAETAENLPDRVSNANITRVYALCAPNGFFHRSVVDRDALVEMLHVSATDAVVLLLADLPGPQTKHDLREWLVRRDLMTNETFARWWDSLQSQIVEDTRFATASGDMQLVDTDTSSNPQGRLERPGLTPARRLDLALSHRDEIDQDAYLTHVLQAWTDGGPQVKDLALAASRNFSADRIVTGFLDLATENVDGLIHALRRSAWEPMDLSNEVRDRMVQRVLNGCRNGGPLDAEGRLTAVMYRWGAPEVLTALAPLVGGPDGQQLVRATLATLPQRRGEELALDLLERVGQRDATSLASQWLGHEVVRRTDEDSETIAARIQEAFPLAAQWLRVAYDPELHDVPGPGLTGEADVTFEEASSATVWADMPPRPATSILTTAIGLARALAELHAEGIVANPSRDTVYIQPDGSVRIDVQTDPLPSAFSEPRGPRADLHAAGVMVVESLLGREWPRGIPVARVLPYLRLVAPDLPTTAIHILDRAVHPVMSHRPPDGAAWRSLIQTAIVTEEARCSEPTSFGDFGLEVGYDTHVGYGKQLLTQTNQDALFVSGSGDMRILIVCDGISTATAGSGDVASGITVQVVANLWEQALPRLREAPGSEIQDFVSRALRVANQAVCEAALRFAGGRLDGQVPMGTTCVMAVTRGSDVWLSWLGDSRAYLVGQGHASLLSADQNQAGDRLRAWQAGIDPKWDPAGFALVGYIGHFNDWGRPEALPPSRFHTRMLPGERLLLCSDGVSDYVAENHPAVAEVLGRASTLGTCDEISRRLVRLANEAGGGDNCSVIIAAHP